MPMYTGKIRGGPAAAAASAASAAVTECQLRCHSSVHKPRPSCKEIKTFIFETLETEQVGGLVRKIALLNLRDATLPSF